MVGVAEPLGQQHHAAQVLVAEDSIPVPQLDEHHLRKEQRGHWRAGRHSERQRTDLGL